MDLNVILPIITLILGWFLNELSRFWGFSLQRTGAIGQALTKLLILREHLMNIQLLLSFFTELKLPPEASLEFKKMYYVYFNFSKIENALTDSITLISSFNPLLANVLSGQNFTISTLNKLFSQIEGKEQSDIAFFNFLSKLENELIPEIDKAILLLSKKHGLITYFQITKYLKKKLEIPIQQRDLLIELKSKLTDLNKENY